MSHTDAARQLIRAADAQAKAGHNTDAAATLWKAMRELDEERMALLFSQGQPALDEIAASPRELRG